MFTLSHRGRRPGGRSALSGITTSRMTGPLTSRMTGPMIGPMMGMVLFTVLIACFTLLALPASAHDALTDSDPAPGESLTEVPDHLALTFTGEISDLGAQFVVTGPEGRDVVQGTPTVDGGMVTQGLVEELADGDYEAAWRVTSSDGHPISGTISFTIAAAQPTGGDTAPDDSDSATAGSPTSGATSDDATSPAANPSEGATTDTATSTVGTAPTATPEGLAAGEVTGREGIPAWGWLVAALAGLGLVACGFLAFRRN